MMKLLFRKTIKFNEEEPRSNTDDSTWKQRCRKWDRSIASMFGLLAFFTLVGIVIFNIFGRKCSNCDADCEENVKTDYKLRIESECTITECAVTCKGITEGDGSMVEDKISAVIEGKSCDAIDLTITDTVFKNAELNQDWLKKIEPVVVKSLTIQESNLKEIKKNAFVGYCFSDSLDTLNIIDAKLHALRRHSFQALYVLRTFGISNRQNQRSIVIEENALEGMRSSLATLLMHNFRLSPENIVNLTGAKAANLAKLIILDLRYNIILELPADSFVNAQKIVSLYLLDSSMEVVDKDAFRLSTNIQLLHLNDNRLTTLSDGTFNNMKLNKLYLGDNPWDCDCSLQWLKDYYLLEQEIINRDMPPKCNGSLFEDYEFCPSTTTVSSISTSSVTVTSTSPDISTTIVPSIATSPVTVSSTSPDISMTTSLTSLSTPLTSLSTPLTSLSTPSSSNCSSILEELGMATIICKSPLDAFRTAGVDANHRAEIVIQEQKVVLDFQELEGDPLLVRVIIIQAPVDISSYYLVWFNSEDKSEHDCVDYVKNNMILEKLSRGRTYTFSVLKYCESETSPKCTFGLNTLPEWSLRAWILNERQGLVIGLTVLVVVCIVCFATCITFLCIRRHPKLISSNKSVIIVKPKKTSEEAAPRRDYEKPTYWDPYLVPSNQGYLTPKYHRYAKVRYRPPLMRSISEWSVSSSSSLYVAPDARRPWKTSQSAHQNQRNEVMEVHDYNNFRPPLPPPNPGPSSQRERRIPDEVLYSSV